MARPNPNIVSQIDRNSPVTELLKIRQVGEQTRRQNTIDASNLKTADINQRAGEMNLAQAEQNVQAGIMKSIAIDTQALERLYSGADVVPEMKQKAGALGANIRSRMQQLGAPTDEIDRVLMVGAVNPADAGKFLREVSIPILEMLNPEWFKDEMVKPGDVTDQGQMLSRDRFSGKVTAEDVIGFKTDPETGQPSPSNVREWEFYDSLSSTDQERFLQMKRANQVIDLGDRTIIPSQTDPSGAPSATFTEGLAPADQPQNIAAAEAAKAGGVNLTPAEKALDTEFGKSYAEYVAGGGSSDSHKQLEQVKDVGRALSSGENLTGPVLGLVPGWIKAFTNPDSVDVREQFEEVVQRNLRLILGAQFTQQEGERLIARAYNPQLSEEINQGRVERLFKQMATAAEAKERAVKYYEANGTLQGFEGKLPTLEDFDLDATDEAEIDQILKDAGIL